MIGTDVTVLRLRYVQAFTDRHGRARHYFRRPGAKRAALPGLPGSAEFMEAYQAALAGLPVARVVATEHTRPGTMSALVVAYYGSTEFKALAESTRYVYRHAIERFRAKFGERSIAGMQSKHVREYLDEFADKPGSAGNVRRVLSILMGFAVERNYRPDNPMKDLRKSKARKRGDGFRAWTDDDIAKFEAHWPHGSRERLALALLLYTAQRRSDVVRMGRQHVKGGKIHVAQQKGGTRLWIPLHPKLVEAIKATPADHLTFLTTRTGGPFVGASFTNWFAAAAQEAGLPPRSAPHGLRKAAARKLAEAGCTDHQIKAITGHKTLAEVALYTASADQERLADQAMRAVQKREKRTSTVKPPERV